ncbi:prolyl 4-hydroxylase subunit alpha-1-like isoform X2 [Acropora muricata]|uniref:prolyl 4-hydroxylase subunit alpha-1-like isoform X2 n=1 Tax=Acropora muricata TaxID=159855 RepID=UPI0034E47B22
MASPFGFPCASVLFLAILSLCEAQIFTALTHMTDFIHLERSFSSILEDYVQESAAVLPPETMRFSKEVKRYLKDINGENMETFLGHPVNSYLLVRRFLREWRDIVDKLDKSHPVGMELVEIIKEHNDSFPDLEDLKGCALAILRIQEVYHISAKRIADGNLSSKTRSPELSAVHCLELGLMKHHWQQYEEAYGWLTEAWERLTPQDNRSGITTYDVLQYLIWAEYKSQAEQDQLTCHYFNKHPLLFLKPAKIEIANLKPNIYLIHDVIRDTDIEFIKDLAMPRLERATVTNRNTGKLEFADYRISKSAWLEDYEGDIIESLSLKLEAITGLSTARVHCEALQVVNYGTGGQYEPHVDHALTNKSAIFDMGMGNRIATVLIYMTDVEAGGSTVFLDAETIIKPQKGTAAFWFNLLKSGEPDQSTRHAACPVIVGTKWVSNKWIHEHGQEFRRKCGLNPAE